MEGDANGAPRARNDKKFDENKSVFKIILSRLKISSK